ncbi:MAG: helix-turn-helix domain-containing protein [Gammaproteobacteria bacterium]|nr:MAG: helix-turn-helix domain-containing protein [Gammaproteobacteria bacterium]
MNNLGNNLKNLLEYSKLSERELARRTGIPQQVINRIVTGQNTNPKLETLLPLSSYFRISVSQLIGDSVLPSEAKFSLEHLGWVKIPLIDLAENSFLPFSGTISNLKEIIEVDAEVSQEGFAIKMADDSMEPKFPKGTLLIFDPNKQIKNGKFYLGYSHNKPKKYFFRQFIIKNNTTFIRCLNPKYSCFKSTPLDSHDEILGVLVQAKTDY